MEYSQVVRKARRRFRFAAANRLCLYILAGELFVVGIAIAILRFYYPAVFSSHPYIVWGTTACLAVLAPIVSYWAAGRFVPSETAVRAWLDNQFSCGGVMAAEEYFPEAHHWEKMDIALAIYNKLGELIPFCVLKPLFICLLSVFFLTSAALVPIPAAESVGMKTTAYIEKDVQRIENKIELLKNEKILDSQQAEQMLQTLQRLSNNADGTDPLHTFEALDALEKQLDKTAQDAARQAEENAQDAQDAMDLSEAMKKDWDKLNDAQKEAAAKELQKALDKLTGKDSENQNSLQCDSPNSSGENGDPSEGNDDSSGENGAEQDSEGSKSDNSDQSSEWKDLKLPDNLNIPELTPEQLEQLENLLKDYQGDLQELLDKLKEGEFEDMEQMQIIPSDEELDLESLQKFLEENCPDGDCEQGIQLWLQMKNKSGSGGQNHGGSGPTPLHFDDNAPDDNPDFDKFKPEKLPTRLTRQAVEQSELKGVTLGNPTNGNQNGAEDLQGNVIDPNAQDGGIGRTQKVYPMHRKSVEGYFDSGIAPRGARRP